MLLGFLVAQAQGAKHPLLSFGVVDPDASTTQLVPVGNAVVGESAYLARVGLQNVDIVGMGRRKRVVHGIPAPVPFVVLQQGEFGHPDELPVALLDPPFSLRELHAKTAENFGDEPALAGDDEQEITQTAAGRFERIAQPVFADVTRER